MLRLLRPLELLLVLSVAGLALSGCLIDTMSADTTNGVTTLQVTATLLPAPPCSVSAAAL